MVAENLNSFGVSGKIEDKIFFADTHLPYSEMSYLTAPGRLKIGPPVAMIDIGSNSVRLVAYEGRTRALTPIYNEKAMCGLARGVASTGNLKDEAMSKALRALRRYKALCETLGVKDIVVLATAAVRDAANGPDFVKQAEEACGHPVTVITGEHEAHLSGLGVIAGLEAPDGVAGDLGGGSLELVELEHQTSQHGISFKIGGLSLQDLSGGSFKKAQKIIKDTLEDSSVLKSLKGRSFYAVGGTWRSLAKLHMASKDYPLRVMHGYRIDPSEGMDFLHLLERDEPMSLKDIENITEARRPLLVYGALILEEIIRIGKPKDILISASGVREGALYDRLDKKEQEQDPLLKASCDLNTLRSRSPQHGFDLVRWTERFLQKLHIDESSSEKRLREAACLLADISWRAHPDYRGEQSLNLIAHAAFSGINHAERAFLALSIFFRHEGLSADKASPKVRDLAGPKLFERARLLAALMRVAYPLSVGMAGILPNIMPQQSEDRVVLKLAGSLVNLAGDRLDNRVKQLNKLVKGPDNVAIQIV